MFRKWHCWGQNPRAALRKPNRGSRRAHLQMEVLEDRLALSGSPPLVHTHHVIHNASGTASPMGYAGPVGFQPVQIRHAYAIDQVTFSGGTVTGDGTGQTIAIVDAYDDPNIANDLAQFSTAFGLPAASFTKVSQTGTSTYPGIDSTGGWETEIALDVEWAHAIAPGAKILLVEAKSSSFSDLLTGVNYARSQAGVSVVSMSWGATEFLGETSYDSYFTTPSGHAGVTFVASSGDTGGVVDYPSASPNVLAVGGTTLSIGSTNTYVSESGWSGSGGGPSPYESQPAYQKGVVTQSTTQRAAPDVAFDADPNSGVAVYDSYNNGTSYPWSLVGGTSFSAPAWAGILAIADQGRALQGAATLDGATGTLPAVYTLPANDFHDTTTGSNGAYACGPGYDLVTGRGSPIANLLVAQLVNPPGAAATHFSVTAPSGATAGTPVNVTVTALDVNGNPATGYTGTVHFTSSDTAAILPADYTFTLSDAGIHTFAVTFKTTGTQTVTVTDKAASSVTGSASVSVSPAPSNTLVVSGYASPTTAGVSHSFTVTVKNSTGTTVTTYTGTVHFTSSDAQAVLPADYTFTATDRGVHTFSTTLKTAGAESLTATDKASATVTGTQSGIQVQAAALNHFKVAAPASATTGVAFSLTVTAQDAYNNTVSSYRGTVAFKSSDKYATLPTSYTFTSLDLGVHTFSVTLRTVGTQTVTVNDTKSKQINGTATVTVGSSSPAVRTSSSTSGGSMVANDRRDLLFALLQVQSSTQNPWL
jgi:subtilase family serine protease